MRQAWQRGASGADGKQEGTGHRHRDLPVKDVVQGFWVSGLTLLSLSLLQQQDTEVSIECVHLLRQVQVKSTRQAVGLAFNYGALIIVTSNGN